jgi:D-alanyl-D-alanine carboxypeptidase
MRAMRLAAAFLAIGALAGCAARQPASPRFTILQRDLPELAARLPADAAAAMRAEPRRFLDLLADTLAAPEDTLRLVDKAHGLDAAYEPHDLLDLAGRGLELSKNGLRLRAVVLEDLLAMSAAARADGVTLVVSSAYRSFVRQGDLWRAALATQPRAVVERELAPPGHSQHQIGTVLDFGSIDDSFAATDAGRWMADNAWRFGWSLSYPEGHEAETGYRWESWHFRWIGRPTAALARDFFGGSQQALLSFLADHGEWLEARLVPTGATS